MIPTVSLYQLNGDSPHTISGALAEGCLVWGLMSHRRDSIDSKLFAKVA